IFYSIGNFLFETETVSLQPYDAFYNKKMPLDTRVGAYMDARSQNGTRGFGIQKNIWRAVLPSITFENGRITAVSLHPIELGMDLPRGRKGVPVLRRDEDTLQYLAELSAPYGTRIEIRDGLGLLKL
ncbi:MAG: CapA family protein, partial [Lachnospiraceae bacterium]|nr:CapA family protein [Lachnospiraceae bacterium]